MNLHSRNVHPVAPFVRLAARLLFVLALTVLASNASAQQMVGQSLLTFASNYVIAPLGIFAIVIALAGSFFRPDLVRHGVLAAVICAVLFFIIKMAPQLSTALRN